jgi:hypothetical protein
LLAYKSAPSQEIAQQLSIQFDALFAATTGYDALDQRMQARIRDINFQTMSSNGTKCKDTFCTIVQTVRKLGVNVYQYLYDRIARKFEIASLADLILLKAEQVLKPV